MKNNRLTQSVKGLLNITSLIFAGAGSVMSASSAAADSVLFLHNDDIPAQTKRNELRRLCAERFAAYNDQRAQIRAHFDSWRRSVGADLEAFQLSLPGSLRQRLGALTRPGAALTDQMEDLLRPRIAAYRRAHDRYDCPVGTTPYFTVQNLPRLAGQIQAHSNPYALSAEVTLEEVLRLDLYPAASYSGCRSPGNVPLEHWSAQRETSFNFYGIAGGDEASAPRLNTFIIESMIVALGGSSSTTTGPNDSVEVSTNISVNLLTGQVESVPLVEGHMLEEFPEPYAFLILANSDACRTVLFPGFPALPQGPVVRY